jgi:hypothetical protein
MSIPQGRVDELLVKCGRRCCICRRFAPLHLQVHHIVERAEGGSDDSDNLIAVCLTCHSDVHTKTLLTRRFTVGELKGHRDALIALVANGALPQQAPNTDVLTPLIDGIVARLSASAPAPAQPVTAASLSAGAVKSLLDAVTSDGTIADVSQEMSTGMTVDDIRELSRNKRNLNELISQDLVRYVGGILYCVSDEGFLLADQILAAS